jgi:8-oxo-dGTP diphosphatase
MTDHITHSLAAGTLVVKDDAILFVRQTYAPYTGMWGFPTGLLAPGERIDEAALRETREEAGITAAIDGVISVYSIARESPLVYVVLLCHHVSGDPVPDGTENDRAVFLTRDELEALPEQIIEPCYEIADLYWRGDYRLLHLRDAIMQDARGRAVCLYA